MCTLVKTLPLYKHRTNGEPAAMFTKFPQISFLLLEYIDCHGIDIQCPPTAPLDPQVTEKLIRDNYVLWKA